MIVRTAAFQWSPEGGGADWFDVRIGRVPLVRALLADGATNAFESGIYARELLLAASSSRGGVKFGAAAAAAAPVIEDLKPDPSAPWWTKEGYSKGSASTLLSLEVHGPRLWMAKSVGDCLLVQLNGLEPVVMWPFERAADFPASPELIRSTEDSFQVQRGRGSLAKGRTFLLMTDTLAQGVLRLHEMEKNPWGTLCRMKSQGGFERFVSAIYRRFPDHQRDDLTLVRIELGAL